MSIELVPYWNTFVGDLRGKQEFQHLFRIACRLYEHPNDSTEETTEAILEMVQNNPADVIIVRGWLNCMGQFPACLNGELLIRTPGDNEQVRTRFRQSVEGFRRMSHWDNEPLLKGLAKSYLEFFRPDLQRWEHKPKHVQAMKDRIVNDEVGLGSSVYLLTSSSMQRELMLPKPDKYFVGREGNMAWRHLNGKPIGR